MKKSELRQIIREEANKILVPRRSPEERGTMKDKLGIELEDDRTEPIYSKFEYMEGTVHMQNLENLKHYLKDLTIEWIHGGFEIEDVMEYLEDFIKQINIPQ